MLTHVHLLCLGSHNLLHRYLLDVLRPSFCSTSANTITVQPQPRPDDGKPNPLSTPQ
ncbi:hypothetical protein OG21DRAFT_1506271 [Imleria badia]|nr:hypothetical protein OG21DRAFT_1506271 [Imleria badia]